MARLISEHALALCTLWQECRGEPYLGQVAVAQVIRNRMARRYLSDGTVAGTVLRSKQFSGWNDDDPNRVPSVQLDADDPLVGWLAKAWEESLTAKVVTDDAVHYLNPELVLLRRGLLPSWAADPKNALTLNPALLVARYGQHAFLRAPRR